MARNASHLLATLALGSLLFTACGNDPEDTGTEYAPQMYHSIAYEDYTQIVDTTSEEFNSNPYNANRSNLRKPPVHTIARKQMAGTPGTQLAADIMEYNIPHQDSIEWSARNLKNPLQATPAVLEEGKALYTSYCSSCHGAEGNGQGKVAEKYKGVPSYKTGAIAKANSGHIFHVITYGKNRMWPHGTQILPQDRWKIVHYVHTLQASK